MSEVMRAHCHKCGWNGWSNETHICEFGKVAPAMQNIMKVIPKPDFGGALMQIAAKESKSDQNELLQALMERARQKARVAQVHVGGEEFAWLRLDELQAIVAELTK